MVYEKSIELLNKIYAADVERMRFSNPVKLINLELGELDLLKNKALDSTKEYKERLELKQVMDLSDHKNYFSDEYENKEEIFMDLIQDDELYQTFNEERGEAEKFAQKSMDEVYREINKARQKIQNVIEETEKSIQDNLGNLQEVEMKENYLINSRVPVAHFGRNSTAIGGGINRYIDYIDTDKYENLDEIVPLGNKKRNVTPTLRHINSLDKNSFKYHNFDTRKTILEGVIK